MLRGVMKCILLLEGECIDLYVSPASFNPLSYVSIDFHRNESPFKRQIATRFSLFFTLLLFGLFEGAVYISADNIKIIHKNETDNMFKETTVV